MQTRRHTIPSAPEPIVITGFGLFTPIGESFWQSMLSLRARRSRYQEHETVLVADSLHGEILRGATISRVADRLIHRNLTGAHRAAALLARPVAECLEGLPLELGPQVAWQIVARHAVSGEILRDLISEMLPNANLSPDSICQSRAIRSDFFAQIANAAETLLANRAELVAVACVDSLCDPHQLEELLSAGLLKDASNPYGIMAGEAAGAVLLERESKARKRGAPVMARIAAWGGDAEPHPWPTGSPSTAQGLTGAFHNAFAKLEDGGACIGQVVTDENGQRPRALEWALTAGRVFPNADRERILRHPAVIAGDAGGALGAVLLADALAQLAWHRPPGGAIALATSDDQGERRVLCLEPGARQVRRTQFADLRKRLGCEKKAMETM